MDPSVTSPGTHAPRALSDDAPRVLSDDAPRVLSDDAPRVLSDDVLEHVVGGAGPVSPGMLRALLRGAPRAGNEAGAADPAPAG